MTGITIDSYGPSVAKDDVSFLPPGLAFQQGDIENKNET